MSSRSASLPWSAFTSLPAWDGLSSMGGLLGGALAAVVFFRVRGLQFAPYADSFALGIAPGWAIARLGCFSVHDHSGVLTSFFLAVRFPDGARHDLGLYDALVLFALTWLLYSLARRKLLAGRLLAVLALGYGTARFGLDFLRATDVAYADARYLGLTPAQYASVLLVVYGAVQVARRRSERRTGVEQDEPAAGSV
jgi:phosphatidylglycerol:prolipoprotein diacylglycerol transferase